MSALDEFKRNVAAHLPGLLASFDMADAKRRNFHLGHQVVDGEIEELDRQIRASAALSKRVGGDEWLALFKTQSIEPLETLLREHHWEREFRVGWKSTGEKDDQTKVVEHIVQSRLVRSLRCLYAFAADPQQTDGLIDKLLEHNRGLPPNTPIALSDAAAMKKIRWDCVTNYPAETPFCPFCQGRDFKWEDGGTGVYDASGICKACGASVDIRGIEECAI